MLSRAKLAAKRTHKRNTSTANILLLVNQKMSGFLFFACAFVLLLSVVIAREEIHVCQAADPQFLGTYLPGRQQMDGTTVFSNANDMSFFRNRGFWYLGNLGPWPPETHYRCVEAEGCNFQMEYPPSNEEGIWKGSKRFNNENSVLVVSSSPCPTESKDEL
jgi:hypothetical protein